MCKIKDCKIIKFFTLRNATRSFVVIFVDQTKDYFVRFHICFLTPDLHKDKEKNLKRNQSKGLVRSNCKIFFIRDFFFVFITSIACFVFCQFLRLFPKGLVIRVSFRFSSAFAYRHVRLYQRPHRFFSCPFKRRRLNSQKYFSKDNRQR